MPPTAEQTWSLSPRGRTAVRAILIAGAVIGLALGIGVFQLHMASDPLADVHAYYDAGVRLNAGLPLYDQPANTDEAAFYRYPPLLAILFRPLAMLPFEGAAAIWMVILLVAVAATVLRLPRGQVRWIALGMLAMPMLWTLAVGQAQALVTLLLALGSPLGVAMAGHLKLTPWLAAIYWVGRRDLRSLLRLAGWVAGLAVLQLALAPQATLDYFRFPSLTQVGEVRNLSPYGISPVLWVLFVAGLAAGAWRLAPTRWGWAAAVALAVLSSPRLLSYQLVSLLAGLSGPHDDSRGSA
jgi:hypothetical protein